MVEAVRAGMIFSKYENRNKYAEWRRKRRQSDEQVGLTGQALENAIMGFAAQHPEYVTFGGPA